MRSLSLSSPVASRTHTHTRACTNTHNTIRISSTTATPRPIPPTPQTTLLCQAAVSLLFCRLDNNFFFSACHCQLCIFQSFQASSSLIYFLQSNHHTHHNLFFPPPHITITITCPGSPPCPITAPLFVNPRPSLLRAQCAVITSTGPRSPPLLPLLCLPTPSLPTFARQVMPLEAAEQRNCLLSRVDFSCACKLLCIDTLSEQGHHNGPGQSPPCCCTADLGGATTETGAVMIKGGCSLCVFCLRLGLSSNHFHYMLSACV